MKKQHVFATLGVVLLLSLAANVYFGGHHLGRWASAAPCDRKEWREKEAMLQERLSPEDYAVVKKHKAGKKKAFKADREKLADARANVDKAMRADDFDAAALEAALAAESKVKMEVLQRMRAGRDAMAKDLSPEGREILKDVMKNFRRPPHDDILPPPRGERPPAGE